ncbi:hypothetical protein NPIL_239811 [Nephila pilipes]|uniref:Uncharacterized protein n=1 Tax=Nephila pilipes TaxID=299642 RepID=A0A8X6NS18_NEPPI|nr:hypothetical protein NPIL_239811 [Nephila pilipes]
MNFRILNRPTFPSLRQRSLVVIAIWICNDPEVKDFMKKYGPVACVFPSKLIRMLLNKTPSKGSYSFGLFMNESKSEFFASNPSSVRIKDFSPYFEDLNLNKYGFSEDFLPWVEWEELIERKISYFTLPKQTKK